MSVDRGGIKAIAGPSLRRLPTYLRMLSAMEMEGISRVSCTDLALRLAQDATQVRKDLNAVGVQGTPRIGFPVGDLRAAIVDFLGWNRLDEAFLVGAGNLGRALTAYEGFRMAGLRIVAAFDGDAAKAGKEINGVRVLPMDRLPDMARRLRVHIGIVAVPASAAQEVADALVAAGVRGIWNFAPRKLLAPDGVVVENAELTPSLAALTARLKPLLAGLPAEGL